MSIRCLLLVALIGCKDKPPAAAPAPVEIVVQDGSGSTIAALRPSRPCRASVGPLELIVGGAPLVAQLGSTRWSSSAGANGLTLLRDGERVARVFPVGDDAAVAVLDMTGVALARVAVSGTTATVSNAAGVPVRTLTTRGAKITSDTPAVEITGTTDLVVAALLTASELAPEVRMLAACNHVLGKVP